MEGGETYEFKIIEKVANWWLKAGILLRFSKSTLDKYRDRANNHDIKSCEYVFSKWIKDDGHEDYPLTWVGLHTLLIDMGKRTVAENLYKVLKRCETNTQRYVDTMYRQIL